MINVVESLLGVEYYKISENYIARLREKRVNWENVFKILPEFTTNTNEDQHNQPMLAEFFHQFQGWYEVEEPKIFIYFNLKTIDNLLQEEIDNTGIDDLFRDYDFEKILSVFKANTDYDMKRMVIPRIEYLIIKQIYDITEDHYYGGYECDAEFQIIGYLDEKLNKKYYNHEEIYKGKNN